MSNNIDVQYHEDGGCVRAYVTDLTTGKQSNGLSCSGNSGQKKANALKEALRGLPKVSSSSSNKSQDTNRYSKPYTSDAAYPPANYTDGFPNTALSAINFCTFLTPAEKKEWRDWTVGSDYKDCNELVHTLHSMWVTDKAKNSSVSTLPDYTSDWNYDPKSPITGQLPDINALFDEYGYNSTPAKQPKPKTSNSPTLQQIKNRNSGRSTSQTNYAADKLRKRGGNSTRRSNKSFKSEGEKQKFISLLQNLSWVLFFIMFCLFFGTFKTIGSFFMFVFVGCMVVGVIWVALEEFRK